MGKKSDDDTRVILKNLAIIVPAFYAIYFAVAAILAAAFELDCDNAACRYHLLPFYTKLDAFRPEGADQALVAWLAQVLTFLLSASLMYFVVRSTARSWDYACTLLVVHTVVTTAVDGTFPTNWVWWVTALMSTFALSSLGEISNYWRDMKDIQVTDNV